MKVKHPAQYLLTGTYRPVGGFKSNNVRTAVYTGTRLYTQVLSQHAATLVLFSARLNRNRKLWRI